MAMIRAFIALELTSELRERLEDLQRELKKSGADVRWTRPQSIHLTLKFLGDIAPEKVEEISRTLEAVAGESAPFTLRPESCGAFPSIKKMRVVWAGLAGESEPLLELQKRVETAVAALGFEPEDRPFKPHLTLGRVKGRKGQRELRDALVANQGFRAEAFDVTEVVLYKSELRPEGARYTALFRAPLREAK
jgi:2'-5' RNA ligase